MEFFAYNALVALVALVIDAMLGDPDRLWRRMLHPVAVIGLAIAWFDRRFNDLSRDESVRRRRGVLAIAALVIGAVCVGALVAMPLRSVSYGFVLEGALASVLIAQKSLYTHVRAVRDAFDAGGLGAARHAVSMIVGRDPNALDEAGVSRAAMESASENFSDGVVAPALWCLLFGLPGLVAYKAINTADSMIGHKTERHRAFGWAAARLDDLVNLPASRLSGLVIAAAAAATGRSARGALAAMQADASKHASPNAGWPESAFAGALDVALGGPRAYSGVRLDGAWMNGGGHKDVDRHDLTDALRLLRASCGAHIVLMAAVAAAIGLL